MKNVGATHLHVHSCANAAIIAMMAKRLSGIPFSLALNANIEWWGGAMAEKFADAAFTVSHTEWLLAQLRRDFPSLRSDQALLAPVGVDTRRWKRSRPPRATDVERIVTVGRLHAGKGHDVLLRALKQLLDAGRRASLRIIGAGPERGTLEKQAHLSGLDRSVMFMGTLSEDEIIEQLEDADLFVLASHAESLGVVYMEAMAMELPALGTNVGGWPKSSRMA
jgi:glycosyltransferase involved in cell wall biosynthesis